MIERRGKQHDFETLSVIVNAARATDGVTEGVEAVRLRLEERGLAVYKQREGYERRAANRKQRMTFEIAVNIHLRAMRFPAASIQELGSMIGVDGGRVSEVLNERRFKGSRARALEIVDTEVK